MNDFIKLTDKSVSYAFQDIVIESREQLSKMEREIVPFITFFKNLFNRARPKQINPSLNVFESVLLKYTCISIRTYMSGILFSQKIKYKIS